MVEEESQMRFVPQTDLDLNLMLTDSVWGRAEVSKELKNKLSRFFTEPDKLDEHGNPQITKESLWGLLGFFTRDMRLGNLSKWDGELKYARYMIDLANDLLNADMIEPFLIALSRSANLLETSQSKDGFLRKQMNTLRNENTTQTLDPPKKGVFGGKKERH